MACLLGKQTVIVTPRPRQGGLANRQIRHGRLGLGPRNPPKQNLAEMADVFFWHTTISVPEGIVWQAQPATLEPWRGQT